MERELTAHELGVLEFMLADPTIPGGDALRAQIPNIRAVDGTPRMPTYLHLAVAPGTLPADCPDGKVPVDAVVFSPLGEPTGFILLWTEAGFLATVEHAWVTDEMPSDFPAPERLRRRDPRSNRMWDPRAG